MGSSLDQISVVDHLHYNVTLNETTNWKRFRGTETCYSQLTLQDGQDSRTLKVHVLHNLQVTSLTVPHTRTYVDIRTQNTPSYSHTHREA